MEGLLLLAVAACLVWGLHALGKALRNRARGLRKAVTWAGIAGLAALVLSRVASPPLVAFAVTLGLLLAVMMLAKVGWSPKRRLPGVPDPPQVVHQPGMSSGLYAIDACDRTDPRIVRHVKVGKSGNVENRVSGHVTISSDLLRQIGDLRTADYHAVEGQVHRDLRPWAITGVRAVELYVPAPEVYAYLEALFKDSGGTWER